MNLIYPQHVSVIQDALCGIRKFTLRDCSPGLEPSSKYPPLVPEWDGMALFRPAILKPKPLLGKQILVPRGLNIYRSPDLESSARRRFPDRERRTHFRNR